MKKRGAIIFTLLISLFILSQGVLAANRLNAIKAANNDQFYDLSPNYPDYLQGTEAYMGNPEYNYHNVWDVYNVRTPYQNGLYLPGPALVQAKNPAIGGQLQRYNAYDTFVSVIQSRNPSRAFQNTDPFVLMSNGIRYQQRLFYPVPLTTIRGSSQLYNNLMVQTSSPNDPKIVAPIRNRKSGYFYQRDLYEPLVSGVPGEYGTVYDPTSLLQADSNTYIKPYKLSGGSGEGLKDFRNS